MNTHRIAVFLGPSCQEREAKKHLENADYYPPAFRGSFYNIINDGYETIVLIDGLFYASLSVWHKEIIFALDSGIRVIGASSMGALRAAELQGTGIVGVGTIFGWYRDGFIDGDDEVALLHRSADDDFAGLTIPLVNLRWNLRKAVKDGVLEEEQEKLVIGSAKRLSFMDRTLTQILDPLRDRLDVASLGAWLKRNSLDDLKRMDTIEALTLAARESSEPQALEDTSLRDYEAIHMSVGIEYFWSERLNSIKPKIGDRETPLSEYLKKINPETPEYRNFVRARGFHKLIVGWATELELDRAGFVGAAEDDATWTPDTINAAHRKETGLTLVDLARERRDAKIRSLMQKRFCAEAAPDLLRELDERLSGWPQGTGGDCRLLIALDSKLIYTLWRLGKHKNIVHGWVALDGGVYTGEAADDSPETAETILNFAEWIDRASPALFGYTFDPAREILLAHQYFNRLEAIGRDLG